MGRGKLNEGSSDRKIRNATLRARGKSTGRSRSALEGDFASRGKSRTELSKRSSRREAPKRDSASHGGSYDRKLRNATLRAGEPPTNKNSAPDLPTPQKITCLSEAQQSPDIAIVSQQFAEQTLVSKHSNDTIFSEDAFLRRFGERLAYYQLLVGDALNKYAFETSLEHSMLQTGISVNRPDSSNHAGHDLIINGERFSLKTEAARAIREDRIHISKLMESAWSKTIKSKADAAKESSRIIDHLQDYDRILTLRAFRDQKHPENDSTVIRYDLTEIPKTVLGAIEQLKPKDFAPLSKAGSTRADVQIDGHKAFTLVFDGSDNKITIRGIDSDLCQRHASWWAPLPEISND